MLLLLNLLAIIIILLIPYLLSSDRKMIKYHSIVYMLIAQVLITLFMFKTTVGRMIINFISSIFEVLINFGLEGVSFVFGGITDSPFVFFFNVLLIIIFFSAMLGILNFLGILPWVIRIVGSGVSAITRLPKLESFNASASMVFGQSEVFLAIKDHLDDLDKARLYTISASAMSSVSASIMGSYMTMVPAQYVLAAIPLNMLSGLIIATILMPSEVKKDDDTINLKNVQERGNFFEVLSDSIMDGAKIAVIVAAMLIGYIALMSAVNSIITFIGSGVGIDTSLQEILGFLFSPFAILLGIPVAESVVAGSIMGTKLVLNEFVAMTQLQEVVPDLSERTIGIISTFLISFANFSSIGIIAGSVKALNERQSKVISEFGFKLLLGATLASLLSAAMVGLFL
ncbi:CNT family concentrative nucleoside transporter/nucleoside transport protein [Bacillus mesophilus]|uniref:NupC/NupG family nucleoside CNT transporter n=1 Tax=Bacillus mesophilus TaxID=1808955 RepID=A0A6M0Q407_9BACI|nr:nucleoside transporter C-terminal domain-containing protein [Bacillus mesophilus]MBM7660244.1 CNT family concentrative nucleoside transporter/nucleoside transport protein [Bacillus mesophilus]NEY70962.1 NupC/NupG family nucleoside CNT transporter [Bacillus mesophilus]